MSEPFTKIITYLFLIFLVWEQLGHHELKYHSDAQSLPAQEVSALQSIAIQLQLTENGVYVSDEIDSSLCDKADQSTKIWRPSADIAAKISGGTNNPTGRGMYPCSKGKGMPNNCDPSPKSSVSSFTRNIKCSCNTDANNVTTCHVTGIDWSNKKLEGVIVEKFGSLTYLETLDLSYNKLQGTIPDIWRKMSSLYMLDLSDNRLTGNIPQNLGNLKFLKILYLERNLLSGSIPESLGKITYLRYLSLSDNQLSGQIPPALGNLRFLETLQLDSNNFTGELPPNFSKLKNLEYFSIAGNNLAGRFPHFITDWPNITSLNLVGNNFSGNIPAEIFNRSSLYHLMISDLTDSSFQFPSFNWTNSSLYTLVLRNCSINGSIPENIGFIPRLYKLDLSFNELTGNIPSSLGNVSSRYLNSYISLAENKLNGAIPDWIPNATKNSIGMDLSFNDFSNSSFNFGLNYTKLNLFSCCRSCNSSTCESQMKDVSEYSKNVCQSQPKKKTLHINCGGEETDINGIIYENDTDSSPFYKSPHGNWARISSGEQSIVEKVKCGIFVTDAPLYDEARVSTVSLKYYGLCLEDGEYNVTLHFAEIKFANNTDEADNTDNDSSDQGDQSSKKRIFNINIQNQWVRTDFNIKETAGEAKKETKVEVPTVQVNNSRLEIHLYWAGKGSYSLNNGPLISAISVVPSDIKRGKLSRLHVALISVASVVVFVLLLVFIIAWAMGWLRKEEMHEIRVGPEKIVTLKQLMDATRRFSKEMEIGRGGLGIVYKAELPDKQMVAVKRLSTLSSEGIDKLKSEFYTMETLRHENLVQLFDLFFGKDLYLLIYEYMENKSLADALFDSKYKIRLSWEARFNICLGIAKGLQYLHEHPRLKMVHRGVKAVNILLDSDLKPKISDFGLASVYAEDDQGAGQLKIIKSEASQYVYPIAVASLIF